MEVMCLCKERSDSKVTPKLAYYALRHLLFIISMCTCNQKRDFVARSLATFTRHLATSATYETVV